MSTAAEKANLARIRDNQRRSRARRKEYLQELEARLRQCELQGIEASSEIQLAARRVADENKKLRSLLAQHGVGNEMVETYLQMSSEDLMISAQYGSESPSVQQLEQLLQARKLCCADGSIGPTSTTTMGQTIQSRESSYSGNTVHSVWDPVQPSRSMSVGQTPTSTGKGFSQAQQFMSPRRSSAASRHSSISQNHSTAGTVHTRQQQQQQQQQRFNMTPITLPNSQQQNTPSSLSIQSPQIYEYESQYISNQSYNTLSPQTPQMHSHLQSHTNSNPNSRSSVSSHQMSPPISSTYNTNIPSENNGTNLNSCVFATDMITTMAGGDPAVVRAELGCVPGMDCNVDNQLVFHVMDRYSENGVGL
ncbi:hypothetical protein BELL_0750g00050 [Botrytis elliptica]|uniref:BZIP domain-containing protein n=1 Tax=Botrytis elliptica TaxID=278938 RepID=A0A4Z1J8I2_9HELO|nr:hypothetical protein EAE99_006417 [Botrytis elliptica]TGO69908.1 hypothetical protein BELL_0750g00050 [Botrytis elliptica]